MHKANKKEFGVVSDLQVAVVTTGAPVKKENEPSQEFGIFWLRNGGVEEACVNSYDIWGIF